MVKHITHQTLSHFQNALVLGPQNQLLTPWSLNGTCWLHYKFMVSKLYGVLTETSPFPFFSANDPTSHFSLCALYATLLSLVFRCLCLLLHKNDTVTLHSSFTYPCPPLFPWSGDTRSLPLLVEVIPFYLPRLHPIYFTLSPIPSFSHQSSSLCPISKTKKNVPTLQISPARTACLPQVNTHSLSFLLSSHESCPHSQSLFSLPVWSSTQLTSVLTIRSKCSLHSHPVLFNSRETSQFLQRANSLLACDTVHYLFFLETFSFPLRLWCSLSNISLPSFLNLLPEFLFLYYLLHDSFLKSHSIFSVYSWAMPFIILVLTFA